MTCSLIRSSLMDISQCPEELLLGIFLHLPALDLLHVAGKHLFHQTCIAHTHVNDALCRRLQAMALPTAQKSGLVARALQAAILPVGGRKWGPGLA